MKFALLYDFIYKKNQTAFSCYVVTSFQSSLSLSIPFIVQGIRYDELMSNFRQMYSFGLFY